MRYGLTLAFVLLALCATPLFALDYPCADNESECGGTFEGDEETGGDGTGSSSNGRWVGGQFTSCNAYGRWGQRCYDAVAQALDPSKKVCALVSWDAHCACHTGTFTTYGTCFYNT